MGVRINISKCTGCGSCLPVCPLGVLQIQGGHNSIGPGCNNCGACEKVCMFDALIFTADETSAQGKQEANPSTAINPQNGSGGSQPTSIPESGKKAIRPVVDRERARPVFF